MGSIRFSVCGCQSENPFVHFGAKSTQRAGARDHPRLGRGKGGPREDRSRPSAEGSRRDRSAGEVIQEKNTVSSREQKRPVDRTGQSGR